MNLGGIFSIIAVVLGVLLLIPLIVGAVFVVVVVANRAEPDPSGRRPALVYSLGTAFITLFVTLFATTSFVAQLCRLIGSHGSGSAEAGGGGASFGVVTSPLMRIGDSHIHPLGDSVARGAVLSAIIAIIAGLVCAWHLRAAAQGSASATRSDQLGRVLSSYVAAVAFVSVAIVIGALVVVIYDVFRGAAPGVFTSTGRGDGVNALRSLIPAFYLAVAAAAILLAHLRYAPPPFRPNVFARWFGGPPPAAPDTVAVVVEESVVAEPVEIIESQPPRKATPRKTTPRKTTPRKTTPRKTTET